MEDLRKSKDLSIRSLEREKEEHRDSFEKRINEMDI